jgi:Flp pilus assembly protein TadD
MNDAFSSWKVFQDSMIAMQKAQLEAATRLMPRTEHFDGAIKAAQQIADANTKAWEMWMSMWGVKK